MQENQDNATKQGLGNCYLSILIVSVEYIILI